MDVSQAVEQTPPSDYFRFEVVHESSISAARVGRISTPHGVIDTPAFVPVGTNGAIKAVSSEQAIDAGVQLMFANTYHLMVHPGADCVADAGGLHKFMGREAPIIPILEDFKCFHLGTVLVKTINPSQARARSHPNRPGKNC